MNGFFRPCLMMANNSQASVSVSDIHQSPDRHESIEFLHVGVEQGNTPQGPVNAGAVECLSVRPVNANRATNTGVAIPPSWDSASRDVLPVVTDVLLGRVIEEHKAGPTLVVIFVDDHVQAGRRTLVAFVELLARLTTDDHRITTGQAAIPIQV